jgi:hypothetical protein
MFVNPLSESVGSKAQPSGAARPQLCIRDTALSDETADMTLSGTEVIGRTLHI